jgi:hypothetical protein
MIHPITEPLKELGREVARDVKIYTIFKLGIGNWELGIGDWELEMYPLPIAPNPPAWTPHSPKRPGASF